MFHTEARSARMLRGLTAAFCLALLGGAPGSAGDLIPRDRRNLSLRNEAQIAIDRGLGWLRGRQDPAGHWSPPEYPAITGLVLIAHMHEPTGRNRAPRPEPVRRGYEFLLSKARPDGGIHAGVLANYNTCVGLAALQAAEDPAFEDAMRRARTFIVGQQADFGARGMGDDPLDGGIGYGPEGTNREHPDLSNTMFALEALHATRHLDRARERGAPADLDWQAAIAFVARCQNLPGSNPAPWVSDAPADLGGFVYFPGHSMAGEVKLPSGRTALRSYGSMSYAGLLSYIYAGLTRDDPRVVAVVDWLRRNYSLRENPGLGPEGLYYYYHTLAKALSAAGIDRFKLEDGREIDWRAELVRRLLDLQRPDGYWINESGRWMERDPVLVTAYAVLTLETVYRGL